MPVGVESSGQTLHHIPNSVIKAQLSMIGKLIRVSNTAFDGPAERFKIEGAQGEIGFISPLTHHFCHACNRLRLTASGNLRPCLLSDQEEDIKGPMRRGASDDDLAQIFLKAAFNKPYSHHLNSGNCVLPSGQMSAIGG